MDIFSEILSTLRSENRVMLATIIATSGSTPASAFSKMLIKGNGSISVGTVGGGCLEGDVLRAAKGIYNSHKAEILTFHLNQEEFVQGLICGGSVDILIEPLTTKDIPLFQELKRVRDDGEDCIVATFIDSDKTVGFKRLVKTDDPTWSNGLMGGWRSFLSNTRLDSDLLEELRKTHRRNETRRIKATNGELILEPVAGNPNLLIFGGGHVSKQVCEVAATAGFQVTVIDDREEYANPRRFPDAVETIAAEYPDALTRLTVRPSTYVVIVTRGHRSDEEILEQVVNTSAKYIGMIGSKRKVFAAYEHLVERGVTVESLERIHAPMGIEIGATTVEEIAISIVAELVAVRRGEYAPFGQKSAPMRDLISRLERKERKGQRSEVRDQRPEGRERKN